jgi:hypothetical protein
VLVGRTVRFGRSVPVMVDLADALQDPVTGRAERGQLQRDWIAASAESGRQAVEAFGRPLRCWQAVSPARRGGEALTVVRRELSRAAANRGAITFRVFRMRRCERGGPNAADAGLPAGGRRCSSCQSGPSR